MNIKQKTKKCRRPTSKVINFSKPVFFSFFTCGKFAVEKKMLIYSKPRQLFNFVRFLTCGRREKNKKSDECEEMGKMLKNESEKKFCRKKTCNNDDNDAECLEENEENWKRQFCPATKRCETSSSLSEIDLSDPCAGKQCRASPPPPPPTPQPQFKESCFCYQDIESCPSANEGIQDKFHGNRGKIKFTNNPARVLCY